MVYLSVVIPAFNEEARLAAALSSVIDYLCHQPYPAEAIVVDDGSSDKTSDIARALAAASPVPVTLIRNESNHGKGYSVRCGIEVARGAIILYTDADLSTPIAEAGKLIGALEAGYDIAFGSRRLPESLVRLPQGRWRRLAGRLFNLLARLLLGLNYRDTQCGFKAFRRAAAREIFSRQRVLGFSFDVELLYIARRLGFKAREVPVVWSDSSGSKVRPLRDGLTMLSELAAIKWRGLLGRYD